VVDLNSDGRDDVISGSYSPGHLFLFARQADGSFARGETIKDKDGIPIRVGYASAIFAADWDADGDLDLVAGNIDGEVHYIPNEGTVGQHAFGAPVALKSEGTAIRVAGGDSGPFLADWDRDGLLDLVVGAGDGSVTLYRNQGTKNEPALATAQPLIPPANRDNNDGTCCGTRTKVCVTDFNQDGQLDLLVGDFAYVQQKAPDQTPEQQAEADKAQAEYDAAMKEYMAAYEKTERPALGQEYRKLLSPAQKETPEEARQREAKLAEIMERMQAIQQQELEPLMDTLMAIQQRLPSRQGTYHGFVWLFLRKAAVPVSAAGR
jgi:hypothetical protein